MNLERKLTSYRRKRIVHLILWIFSIILLFLQNFGIILQYKSGILSSKNPEFSSWFLIGIYFLSGYMILAYNEEIERLQRTKHF